MKSEDQWMWDEAEKAGRSQTMYDHVILISELGLYLNTLNVAQVVK